MTEKKKEKRAARIDCYNRTYLPQNKEKEESDVDLLFAWQRNLPFKTQKKKKKRAQRLIIANELVFQNEEKKQKELKL